jgi:hypothetical protein
VERVCGECVECCFALGVHEFGKVPFHACPHVRREGGCGIYASRPPSCAEFSCVWLQGQLEDEHRPDRVGIVLATADLYPDLQVLFAYVSRFDADKEQRELLSAIAQQIPIVVLRRDGTRSVFIAEDKRDLLARIKAAADAKAIVDEKGQLRRLPLAP